MKRLIRPAFVPIGILTKLEAAGVRTTDDVHRHIKAGTLQELPGIGPITEARILRYYKGDDNDTIPKAAD